MPSDVEARVLLSLIIFVVIVIFNVLVKVICIVRVIVTADHPTTPRISLSPDPFIDGAAKAKTIYLHTRRPERLF